ncbi:MAG: NAD(P)/FAD-dependent oxidoreductase [Oscillospiraceae bacterium]|nr:NAD(P)/FAD-dependent oxidoreductase [Oscillospiraceae bacterium]
MKDIIIIGSGPAGVSAALYALRAGLSAIIVAKGMGALSRAEKIENYYGLEEPLSGAELHERGLKQARALGAEYLEDEVVAAESDGESFTLKTAAGLELSCRALIAATGTARVAPKLEGLERLEGRGVSYCAVCDGFFYRGKPVCVLGSGEFAAHEAAVLLPLASSLTILTNGEEPAFTAPEGVSVDKRPLAALEGEDKLEFVRFKDGSSLEAAGLFIALGTADSGAMARTLGAAVESGRIAVDESMASTLPGFYAAGDCTGGLLQVAKAVYEGALAGGAAAKYVRSLKAGR